MAVGRGMPGMAFGRASPRGQTTDGTSFNLGAVGKSIGDWFTGTALPWLRDVGAPAVLGAIDPTLKDTYVSAKDKVVAGRPWQEVVGGIADDITGKVIPKAIGTVAPGLSGAYGALQGAVGAVKGAAGLSTEDILRGGRKRPAEQMDQPALGADTGQNIAQAAGRRIKNFRQ